VAVFVVCAVVALVMASAAQGQQSKEEKAKLTGAEVQDVLFKPGAVTFGVIHPNNQVYVIVSHGGGNRDFFWRSLTTPDRWSVDAATAKIVGDQVCSKWTFGPESCLEVYRIGGDKYESRLQGGGLVATWYHIQKASEDASKGKVKLTGTQLQEENSKPHLIAGVHHPSNTVWIMEDDGTGKRSLYWRLLAKQGVFGTQVGTGRVSGDQVCSKYTPSFQENCHDVYKINEDKREGWLNGQLDSTSYRLK
jgi:hypothetical protein